MISKPEFAVNEKGFGSIQRGYPMRKLKSRVMSVLADVKVYPGVFSYAEHESDVRTGHFLAEKVFTAIYWLFLVTFLDDYIVSKYVT